MAKFLVRNLENASQVIHSICGKSICVDTYHYTPEEIVGIVREN